MKLLLDAHISGRVIGRRLRGLGHDVVALDEHRRFEGIDDPSVLEIASRGGRVLITHNIQDFPEILREWAEAGKQHAGCIIVAGIMLDDFGAMLRAITKALDLTPDQTDWQNRPLFVGRVLD